MKENKEEKNKIPAICHNLNNNLQAEKSEKETQNKA